MSNEKFWQLVDMYESKDISADDAMKIIVSNTIDRKVAYADYSLLVKRTITDEEKTKIKELLNAKYGKESVS